jgi:hypothetical protein
MDAGAVQHNAAATNPPAAVKMLSRIQHAIASEAMPVMEELVARLAMQWPSDPEAFLRLELSAADSPRAWGPTVTFEGLPAPSSDEMAGYVDSFVGSFLESCMRELMVSEDWIGGGTDAVKKVLLRGLDSRIALLGSPPSPTAHEAVPMSPGAVSAEQEVALLEQIDLRISLLEQESTAEAKSSSDFALEGPAMEAAATRIQSSARAWAARQEVAELRSQRALLAQSAALQEEHAAEEVVHEADAALAAAVTPEQHEAARQIQRRARGMLGRARSKRLRTEADSLAAKAESLEAEANVMEHHSLLDDGQEEAAVHIQRVARGRLARQRVQTMKRDAAQRLSEAESVSP